MHAQSCNIVCSFLSFPSLSLARIWPLSFPLFCLCSTSLVFALLSLLSRFCTGLSCLIRPSPCRYTAIHVINSVVCTVMYRASRKKCSSSASHRSSTLTRCRVDTAEARNLGELKKILFQAPIFPVYYLPSGVIVGVDDYPAYPLDEPASSIKQRLVKRTNGNGVLKHVKCINTDSIRKRWSLYKHVKVDM